MAQPYVGEIRMFAGNFAPSGWMMCEGQTLSIAENETLFQLIGTTYGGDGQSTFSLPELRGRIPIHMGSGNNLTPRPLASAGGSESVTLSPQQMPSHSHPLLASTTVGSQSNPTNNVLAQSPAIQIYTQDVPDSNFSAALIVDAGGSQPHQNFMPYLCVNYIISLFGIFPSQN